MIFLVKFLFKVVFRLEWHGSKLVIFAMHKSIAMGAKVRDGYNLNLEFISCAYVFFYLFIFMWKVCSGGTATSNCKASQEII